MAEKKQKVISLSEINDKLNKLIAIIAIQNKTKEEQVDILIKLGYTLIEINIFTGIPPRTIDWIKANLKKGKNKNGK